MRAIDTIYTQTWPLAGLDEALLIAALYLVVVFAGSVRALLYSAAVYIHTYINRSASQSTNSYDEPIHPDNPTVGDEEHEPARRQALRAAVLLQHFPGGALLLHVHRGLRPGLPQRTSHCLLSLYVFLGGRADTA